VYSVTSIMYGLYYGKVKLVVKSECEKAMMVAYSTKKSPPCWWWHLRHYHSQYDDRTRKSLMEYFDVGQHRLPTSQFSTMKYSLWKRISWFMVTKNSLKRLRKKKECQMVLV